MADARAVAVACGERDAALALPPSPAMSPSAALPILVGELSADGCGDADARVAGARSSTSETAALCEPTGVRPLLEAGESGLPGDGTTA